MHRHQHNHHQDQDAQLLQFQPGHPGHGRPQNHDHDHIAQVRLDEDQPGNADRDDQALQQPAPAAVRFDVPVKKIRQRQDDDHLGQLGRLDGYQPGLDPARGAEVGGADDKQAAAGKDTMTTYIGTIAPDQKR